MFILIFVCLLGERWFIKRSKIQIIYIILIFIFGAAITQADAAVITVNDNGGGSYSSIQEAVNNAQNGDTILVSHGVYKENIKVDKELTILSHSTLTGNQYDRTCVIGKVPEENIFNIYSSNVTIEGFHVFGNLSGANTLNVGIYLEGVRNCYLSSNTLVMNDRGIFLNGSQGNYLNSNLISLGSDGIVLENSKNNILSNNLVVTENHGILLNNSVDNTFINKIAGSSVMEVNYINGSIDLMPPLSKIFSDSNSDKMSSIDNILLALIKEKYSTNSRDTREKSDVVGVTELGQINMSLQKGPVFLRIGAEWCPSCQATKPILKALAAEYGGKATVMSIDVDQKLEIKTYFDVRYIPDCSVIMGIENGEYVYMQENGNISKDRIQARLIGLKDKEVFEKVLDLALLNETKAKSGQTSLKA